MSETITVLGNVGNIELTQQDHHTELQDLTNICCTVPDSLLRMDIDFGDLNIQGELQPPAYVLTWPAKPLSYAEVAETIRAAGELFGGVNYLCLGNHTNNGVSYCGDMTAEEEKTKRRSIGEGDTLEAVLGSKFRLLRVEGPEFALVWQHRRNPLDENSPPMFGLIGELPLVSDGVKQLIESTITPEERGGLLEALHGLSQVFEQYAFVRSID